jgi:hypothetical protein
MKQLNFLALFSAVLLSFACIQCTGSDDNPDDPGGGNNLKQGEIVMKTYSNAGYYLGKMGVGFYATAQKITIDWGDGSIDELTLNGVRREFYHDYENENLQKITINAEVLTYLNVNRDDWNSHCAELICGACPNLTYLTCTGNNMINLDVSKCTALAELICISNQLASLDVSKCTVLAGLSCGSNQLTSLDVSKCTALAGLSCGSNQLTANALNSLFNTLPTKTPPASGGIMFGNNPGTSTCDRSIAENKGWTVYSY